MLKNFLQKETPTEQASKSVTAVKTWYMERYESTIIQRNILIIISFICLIAVIIATFAVTKIIALKSFDPFVIKVEEKTGIPRVVNPTNSSDLQGNEALAKYFIKKYLIARETYNPVDFTTLARSTIRLLSSPAIWRQYRGYIRNPENDPLIRYAQKNSTYIRIKSWSLLDGGTKYIVRFSISETDGTEQQYHKVAVIEFKYTPMELSEAERDINPVGFQVTGYRVDDDNS